MAEKTATTLPNGRRIYSALDEDGTKMYVDKHGRVRYSNVHVVSDETDNGRCIYSNTNEDGTKLYTDKNGRVLYSNVHAVSDEPRTRHHSTEGEPLTMATNADVVEMNNRLYAECVAHENTKARLAEARQLYATTSMNLTSAMKRMADVLDSIDPDTCECCDARDAAYSEDYDGIYTGPEYPHSCEEDDPIFYASPESGVARNTTELLEMIDEEEGEEYDRDEY